VETLAGDSHLFTGTKGLQLVLRCEGVLCVECQLAGCSKINANFLCCSCCGAGAVDGSSLLPVALLAAANWLLALMLLEAKVQLAFPSPSIFFKFCVHQQGEQRAITLKQWACPC